MHVLVLNPGSATLKYRLFSTTADAVTPLEGGLIDHVSDGAVTQAARDVVKQLGPERIQAVGCRVVHGGALFTAPIRVTGEVIAAVRDLGRLAPLHNPIAADVLAGTLAALPAVPLYAVFDTAYHATLPEVAWRYAIPDELTRQGIRRYGFHGTSHAYVARRLLHLLNKPLGPVRTIICHLGNGASVCATSDGQSVDTSMGLTPLEGLVMGTRSGDLGPDIVLHLLRQGTRTVEQLDDLLNRQSGLVGLCGDSDMRAILKRIESSDVSAGLALDLFCYRLRKYIGSYAAVLQGVDAIAFTGGIGIHAAEVRARTCRPLAWLGLQFDESANRTLQAEGQISLPGSSVQAWVVPTDEECEIAAQVFAQQAAQ